MLFKFIKILPEQIGRFVLVKFWWADNLLWSHLNATQKGLFIAAIHHMRLYIKIIDDSYRCWTLRSQKIIKLIIFRMKFAILFVEKINNDSKFVFYRPMVNNNLMSNTKQNTFTNTTIFTCKNKSFPYFFRIRIPLQRNNINHHFVHFFGGWQSWR